MRRAGFSDPLGSKSSRPLSGMAISPTGSSISRNLSGRREYHWHVQWLYGFGFALDLLPRLDRIDHRGPMFECNGRRVRITADRDGHPLIELRRVTALQQEN